MSTIEFGAFVENASASRLSEAQAVARSLGVNVSADGTRFAGSGQAGDPIKVVVSLPQGASLTPEIVKQGRAAFDNLLRGSERLTDYALVKNASGQITEVVSLLTAASAPVVVQAPARAAAPAAPVAPAAPRRWNPFARG